jgi:hypothetical protein
MKKENEELAQTLKNLFKENEDLKKIVNVNVEVNLK